MACGTLLSVELVLKGPADPLVAHGALQRRRRKTHQCHPVPRNTGDMPEGVPDLRQRAEVVMGTHEVLKPRLLGGTNWIDPNLG